MSKSFLSIVAVLALTGGACTIGAGEEDSASGDGLREVEPEDTSDGKADSSLNRVCAAGETTLGIDVSYYQGVIDWSRAKAGGVEYAFIRLSDGANFSDPKFATNWAGSKAAGVVRGAYQFFRPAQNVDKQAQMMIDAIGTYEPGDLPPVIDVEATGGLSPRVVADRVRQWTTKVETALGVRPIVYTGMYFWRDQVGAPRDFNEHSLWVAAYTTRCPAIPVPWSKWQFWQYTDRGRVAGIRGNVDMNRFNGTLEDLKAFASGSTLP